MTSDRSVKPPYFRVREVNDMAGLPRAYKETTFAGATTTTMSYDIVVGSSKKTTDVVTPGYRSLIQQGRVINNPFNSKKVERHYVGNGHKVQRDSGSGSTVKTYEAELHYGSVPNFSDVSRPAGQPYNELVVEAGTKAASEVNATDLQGLVEVAEIHKARDLFRFRLSRFKRYLDQAYNRTKKRDIRALAGVTSREISDVVSSNWLRYRYGIMPAIYLVEDSVVGLQVRLMRATARGNVSYQYSEVERVQTFNVYTFYTMKWSDYGVYTIDVRAGILYRPDIHWNGYGFNLREVPSAAVELTPYSFVGDWFVNISPFVRAYFANLGVHHLASWTTVKETYTRTSSCEATWKSPSGYSNLRTPTGLLTSQVTTTERFIGVQKGLAFRRDSMRKIGEDKRGIDALALTFQSLKRLMHSY